MGIDEQIRRVIEFNFPGLEESLKKQKYDAEISHLSGNGFDFLRFEELLKARNVKRALLIEPNTSNRDRHLGMSDIYDCEQIMEKSGIKYLETTLAEMQDRTSWNRTNSFSKEIRKKLGGYPNIGLYFVACGCCIAKDYKEHAYLRGLFNNRFGCKEELLGKRSVLYPFLNRDRLNVFHLTGDYNQKVVIF